MKKTFRLVAALMLLVFALPCAFALGGKDNATDNSLEALKARGQFVLGLDDSFPPMGFRNEANEIVGYDIDLAKEVCARLGVKLVVQPIDWAAKELRCSHVASSSPTAWVLWRLTGFCPWERA